MASKQDVLKRTRLELSDLQQSFYERIITSGDVSRHDLQAEKIDLDSFVLYPREDPSTPLVRGENEDYTLEAREGIVVFRGQTHPQEGVEYVAEGVRSNLFDEEEIELFVDTAFELHTNNRTPAVNYSGLSGAEVYLVALLAKIEALWILITSASYDINIHAPEGMFIPRQQRYQQLQELRAATEEQYREMSNALGVGLYRVEMFDLRRVSRLTGRLVPIYLPREVDDTRPPQRVLPGMSSMGGRVAPNTVTTYDLHVFQGRPFEETFTLTEDGQDLDLDTYPEFEVEIWRTPYAVHGYRNVIPQPEVEVVAVDSKVIVRWSAEDTEKLESAGSYVWTLTWLVEDDPITLLQGDVLVESTFPYKNVNVTAGGAS